MEEVIFFKSTALQLVMGIGVSYEQSIEIENLRVL